MSSFAHDFQEVERRALVDNTAQDVFNILKDLVNHASLHASRWIWELLQNARDAALPGSPLHIRLCINEEQLTFQHNGTAFNTDQVAHLIHHGSTKYSEEGQIGRFGTGFLSTHIISKAPRISGRLTDGRGFAFVLDRRGHTPKDLSESMDRSSKEFVRSVLDGSENSALTDYSTRYDYPLTADVRHAAQQGVESLETYAPYVLAFNHEIGSIEIVREGQHRLYRCQPSEPLDRGLAKAPGGKATVTPVDVHSSSGEQPASFLIAVVAEAAVTVAVAAKRVGDSYEVQFGPQVPRLFMAFPLFGTEGIGFPGVINSRSFGPERPGRALPGTRRDRRQRRKQEID